ncbi:MAG: methyltransferase domain-containing protein [Thermofilaceae archaeon]
MPLNCFVYCPRLGYALSLEEIKGILLRRGERRLTQSVNLGKSLIEAAIEGDEVRLGSFSVPLEEMEKAAAAGDATHVFFLSKEGLEKVAFFHEGRYYKLRNVGEGKAPTLEISGIHMHNIENTDPWSDAKRKVDKLRVRSGSVVLDICTGLGYTASHAALRGATVVTIEKDPAVLQIAEFNPWSHLLASPSITIILGDAFEVLEELPENFFDAAVHDPPRFSLAGELYSLEFYRRLRRVLKKGARVFHYTGWPGKHRGLNIQAGVVRRLRAAGFETIEIMKGYGVVAQSV